MSTIEGKQWGEMKMKTTVLCSMIVLGTISLAASAEEASSTFSWGDVTFQPRAYGGYANYSLESGSLTRISNRGDSQSGQLLFGLPQRGKVDIQGFLGGLGATVATGKFFGDIYYQAIPSQTAYSAFQENITNGIRNYGDIDVKHYDWAISIGYMVNDQWSVFAGYKAGETNSDQFISVNVSPPDSRLFQAGNYSVSFEQDGPFLGTSYSFPIGPGALTLKAAYAYLSGKYTSDYDSTCFISSPDCPNAPVPVLQKFDWKGNSNAFSIGVSWTQPIAENAGFSLGANYHYYKFDASGSQRYTTIVGGQENSNRSGVLEGGNLTEDLLTLTASLFYRF